MSSPSDLKTPKMPYNTRRKSLSLPSLGIHLPTSHASRLAAAANRTSSSTTSTSTSMSEQPPSKRVKRSHSPPSRPSSSSLRREREHKSSLVKCETTPPPSPSAEELEDTDVKRKEINLEGINDEIVEAVLVQLQKTGNRPHLVKELAALLSSSVKIVESSANPSAIVSSRLSSFLKRPCWSASSPCPMAKELETVHPRRTYFYLTTCPHQPLPDPAQATAISESLRFPNRAIISPSLSSAPSRSDEAEAERRRELSPSPEVDLSSPEFDDVDDDNANFPITPIGSLSNRSSVPLPSELTASGMLVRNHRAASPPLEKDEKEFTQAARGMQKRKLSGDTDLPMHDLVVERSSEAEDLFSHDGANTNEHTFFVSSPVVKPQMIPTSATKRSFDEVDLWMRLDGAIELDMRSPEKIALEELDCMFDDF